MGDENLAAIERLIEKLNGTFRDALSGREPEAPLAHCDPDITWKPIMSSLEGKVYRGHDGVRRWLEEMRTDWEVFEPTVEDVRPLGDGYYLVLGSWRARGRASGVYLEGQQGAWIQHWERGKLDSLETFTNRGEALVAAKRIRSETAAKDS